MSQVAKLAKPQLRGYLNKQIKIDLAQAFVGATVGASAFWYFVCRQRKETYANFYKTYDPDKDYERMKKAGVFKGIPSE